MRKFKFNIDDWTGGDTISNSMGDVVGSTVAEDHTFEITTLPTTAVCFGIITNYS